MATQPANGLESGEWRPSDLDWALAGHIPKNYTSSGLHDVVGRDGVLVITLNRTPERFLYSAEQLSLAGIVATAFPATDGKTASNEELSQGCVSNTDRNVATKCRNAGCAKRNEQAIAESHRRALLAAKDRDNKWTAILEDDMTLVEPKRWDKAFRQAWAQVPPESKIVRLSWCMIVPHEEDSMQIYAETGDFILAKWVGLNSSSPTYHPGLCTGGYMVHQDILSEMLGLFPCCAAVDTCYFDFAKRMQENAALPRGLEVMINMAARKSRAYIENTTHDSWLAQHGVMFQARNKLRSIREEQSL